MTVRTFLSSLRAKLINYKIYYLRSLGYIGMANSGMILYLTISNLRDKGIIVWNLEKSLAFFYIGGVLLALFFGWVEVNILKGTQAEANRTFELTPSLVDMKNKIDYLYEKEMKA